MKNAANKYFSGLGSTLFALREDMENRFSKYVNTNQFINATLLDPRYKNTIFPKQDAKKILNIQIKKYVSA